MSKGWIKPLFIVAGLYDLVAGGLMLFAASYLFHLTGTTAPDPGYIQFPALLVVLFGIVFLRIAADPVARREQILYGIGLKASYSGVIFWHKLTGSVAFLYIPFAWADFTFLVLFFLAWRALASKA